MKKITSLFIIFAIFISLFFVIYQYSGNFGKSSNIPDQKIKIATSFYPLYFLATQIGGNLVDVSNITPTGSEPHDYELTNQDIFSIKNSSLLIVTGIMEPWAGKIQGILANSSVKILQVGNIATDKDDPHFWLSPIEFSKAADKVTQMLFELDPKNRAIYSQNAAILNSKFLLLDQKFKKVLTNCQTKSFITSHAAFGYLAKEFSLTQVSIAGISPDEEPSLKRLAEVSQFAKQNNIKYIFTESLLSPKLSNTIAKEIGATTLVLNPLEGLTKSQINANQDYISIMEDNLVNLKIALQCP